MEFTARMNLDLGQTYVFTLVTGEERQIKVIGGTKDGGLEIEVDGVSGSFGELQVAIGDAFIEVRAM